MRIIVTGGCGFIGSHIVDKLVELKHQVLVIDDLSASENEQFYFNEKAEYHKIDICEKEKIESLFDGVDYVFHLAAESRIQPAIKNPSRAYNVNVIGTLNILELSRKYNIKRIMYSSTSSVYGLTNQLPTSEDTKTDCLNPYAHSKYTGEELFRQYWKEYKVDSVVFRYFNVFGPRQNPEGAYAAVIPKWINNMIERKPVYINGDGETSRDFCYVDNVVQANLLSATTKNVEAINQVYNIAVGESTTLNELYNLLKQNLQQEYPYLKDTNASYRNFREGDVRHSLASIDKVKQKIGIQKSSHFIL